MGEAAGGALILDVVAGGGEGEEEEGEGEGEEEEEMALRSRRATL